jgi:pyruvate/2-oxoglutarate dehydrogenase complex dihydrolipoamide dehydrogenase (E3) component
VTDTADVIVLGMGVAGELVAERVADAGLDVVGIEANLVGGECPYWGCIPTKMMTRPQTRSPRHDAPQARRRAPSIPTGRPSHAHPRRGDRRGTTALPSSASRKGGRFVRGRGRLDGPDACRSATARSRPAEESCSRRGRPAIPPLPGLDTVEYWTNRDAVETEEAEVARRPRGGAVGVELAQVFARFGSMVTVVEQSERLLPPRSPRRAR